MPARLPAAPDDGDFSAPPMSDINVTPMVDVMLVLLIIFMVAAPLMTAGVQIHLPQSAAPKLAQPRTPVVVSIDKDGHVFVGKQQIAEEALGTTLAEMTKGGDEQMVLVRGEASVDYGRVMAVMGEIAKAGVTRVSLISTARGAPAAPTRQAPAGSSAP